MWSGVRVPARAPQQTWSGAVRPTRHDFGCRGAAAACLSRPCRANSGHRWLTADAMGSVAHGERTPSRVVGRAAEMAAIIDLLDGARKGLGGVLVVEGE